MTMRNNKWAQYAKGSMRYFFGILYCSVLLLPVILSQPTLAQTVQSQGQVQVTASVPGVPPPDAPVITSPVNESRVKTTPLVVLGTCTAGLEVRIYNNQALAGTAICEPEGTFVINIGLLVGRNDLTAVHYDSFGQPSPESSITTVYVDIEIAQPTTQQTQLIVTDTGVREVPLAGNNRSLQEVERLNVFTQVSRILGVGYTAGPVTTGQAVVYGFAITGLALYAADLILFEATTSTKLLARARSTYRLIFKR